MCWVGPGRCSRVQVKLNVVFVLLTQFLPLRHIVTDSPFRLTTTLLLLNDSSVVQPPDFKSLNNFTCSTVWMFCFYISFIRFFSFRIVHLYFAALVFFFLYLWLFLDAVHEINFVLLAWRVLHKTKINTLKIITNWYYDKCYYYHLSKYLIENQELMPGNNQNLLRCPLLFF